MESIIKPTSLLCAILCVATAVGHLWGQFESTDLAWTDDNGQKNWFIDETYNMAHWYPRFSFVPELFIPLWTCPVFALIAMSQHINGMGYFKIDNWPRCFMFHVILAFFGMFPFAGNLGILSGSCSCVVAFLALICWFTGAGGNANYDGRLNRV